jgi:hypothetical protein
MSRGPSRGGEPVRPGKPVAARYRLRMGTRLLIAAGGAAGSVEQLPSGVRLLIDAADEITVIAPSLPGRLEWLVSDTDKATERADERLRAVLGELDDAGSPARGQVGADDPITAFDDAISDVSPDHLLVGLRPEDHAGWQERGLIDALLARFAIPITVFQLPRG